MDREAAVAAVAAVRGDSANWHDGTFTSWSKERDTTHPYPAGAGESIGVADRDLAPWDKFTTQVDASPVAAARPHEIEREIQEADASDERGAE